jgi:DNA-binding FrmR family transcriptional regulator
MSLYHKENSLEAFRKQTDKYADEVHELENKLYNSGLQNEELKEEVDNCNEVIEQYREKYGDLKNVKNRVIENEIKECIRWIDQQNRDLEMSEMEETMQTEPKDERDDSLSSVIRNIEIEKVPI